MDSPLGIDVAQSNGAGSAPGPAATSPQPQVSFHEVLSALNPLQYLPVVGNIYRALTGDCPPPALCMFGSFVVSGLTGGPVGLLLNAAATVAEKVTGIDPDHIAHELMVSMGIVSDDAAAPPAATAAQSSTVVAAYTRTLELGAPHEARG